MKLTREIAKILITLSAAVLFIFIIQVVLRKNVNSIQTPASPTTERETGFFLEIPQKALWNNYIVFTAEATPGVTCSLLYIPPSSDSQEMSSTADKNGHCLWRWKIDRSQGKGNGRLIITINGKSETHFFEIRSSF